MKQGKYEEGKYVLRAKIDFENVNPTLRDPPIYRVLIYYYYIYIIIINI